MTTAIRLLLIGLVVLLLLALGAWWYLFGPDSVLAAELLPSDTAVLLTIPNAAQLVKGYETSQLKKLIDSPNAQPAIDAALDLIGRKNVDVIHALLPNLSGQSFIAVTHFDPNKLEKVGFILGMKPKLGTERFDTFIEKLKATYGDVIKNGATGNGNVAGVDYQWIKGPEAKDKICVAKYKGWIVTTWGEDSLKDWIERAQKKSSTPSLAQNTEYQQSLERVGKDPAALVYVNSHALAPVLQDLSHRLPNGGTYLEKKFDAMGGIALGTRFEQGEITDRYSFLVPPAAQADLGMSPCPFDTLKFTGPDTRLYAASNVDWADIWKGWQDQQNASPEAQSWMASLKTWAQSENIDIQHNIVDALGAETSIQMEWDADTTYPEAGFFVKLNKPDDFKPTIAAIIDTVRKNYGTVAVINEIALDDHHYASLKFVQSVPFAPTMTEDGDYFGVFLSENQAVRSFKRDGTFGLARNADFVRQVGDKRNGAAQIVFLDTPQLLNRGYQTVLPYLSIGAMFSKPLAAMLKNRQPPADLAWMAPVGTWSFVNSTDGNGLHSYSTSGIGNQGVFLVAGLGATGPILQSMGFFHSTPPPPPSNPPVPPPVTPAPDASTNAPAATPPPAASPDAMAAPSTNPAPAAPPDMATNSAPAPDAPPAPAPSNATPATPSAPPQ